MVYYIIPFISALIGWITNYFAIKMLFYPKKPVNLLLFKLQGIFPKRQKEFATKIAETISNEIFSIQELVEHIDLDKSSEAIKQIISDHLDNHLAAKLKENFPMLAMFINDNMIQQFKGVFLKELDELLPSIIDTFSSKLEEQIDVKKIVEEKVAAFSTDKFEEVLNHILSKELRFIELVGAILGFLIGLVQVMLFNMA